MLDDIDAKPGNMIIVMPPPTPAQPPGGQAAPAAPSPAPATQAAAAPTTLTDIVRSTLAAGIYFSAPAAGSPAAVAVEEIAKQCQKSPAEISQAMATLGRPFSTTKVPVVSIDNKEKGSIYAITINMPPTLSQGALSCLSSGASPEIRLELIGTAREFGPMQSRRVDAAALGQLETQLNAAFGDPANPWRLATAPELLAILPILHTENLWGPNGGLFWSSDHLADGKRVTVETKPGTPDYLVNLIPADSASKATPIWIRGKI
jgi:hypothetical protein